MGAETVVYVKVGKMAYEWIEVQAVTASEAALEALRMPGVAVVVATSYDKPERDGDNER